MNNKESFALVRKPANTLEKTAPRAKRILFRMVADTFALSTAKVNSETEGWFEKGNVFYFELENYSEAVRWYRKAAEQNHTEAQYALGYCYEWGEGVEHDYAEAVNWYRKAAEQNFAPAQYSLGDCYRRGEGVPKNMVEAVQWYLKAAKQGDADAQYKLGMCYQYGEGVIKDEAEAEKWQEKAREKWRKNEDEALAVANAEDAEIIFNRGMNFYRGEGVPQDYMEAVKWLRIAADQGFSEAQYNLTRCYEKIVFAFNDFLPPDAPLIGDSSLLPYPKKAIHYAIAAVMEDYRNKRENTTNQALREEYDKIIPTFSYLLTRLVHDWQEIKSEDKVAIAQLGRFDSFPDWALPLKLKYLDDERASIEACDIAIQVMKDRIDREKNVANF